MDLTGLLIVSTVAFAAPLVVNLVRRLRVPSVVLEILAGIIIGPSVLGWVHIGAPIEVISTLGLSMLLFLAGMEIDFAQLRGRLILLVGAGMVFSLLLAIVIALGLSAAGLTQAPMLVAIVLAATGLGIVLPILKDNHVLETVLGRVVAAGATVAEFTTILLLSLFFSRESTGTATKLVLLAAFALGTAMLGLVLLRVTMATHTEEVFRRLQDTTAQIRVRFAVVLFIAFATLAGRLGLETILGAFVAGAMLKLVDKDAQMSHPLTATKLEAIGFGFLVPVFFVASGLRFDTHALFASVSTAARVPVFLVALLIIRAIPAIVYRSLLDSRRTIAAGLFQATSLSFIVAATQIGLGLRVITPATSAALVAAGLLSVVLFPPLALAILSADRSAPPSAQEIAATVPTAPGGPAISGSAQSQASSLSASPAGRMNRSHGHGLPE